MARQMVLLGSLLWTLHVYGQVPSTDTISFTREVGPKAFASGSIHALCQDLDGFLWIGTSSGLYRYDGEGIRRIEVGAEADASPVTVNVIEIQEDPDGTLWIGTDESGFMYYDRDRHILSTYPLVENDVEITGDVRAIYPDANCIWLGTQDGLIKVHRGSSEFIRRRVVENPQSPDEKRQNIIRQIRRDPNVADRLWFSTLSGFYSIQTTSGKIDSHWCTTYPVLYPLEDESDNQYMYAGFEWQRPFWLLGSWGGGHYIYDPVTQNWARYLVQKKNPSAPLSDNVILQYACLNDSSYFFSGSRLGVIDPRTGDHTVLWLEPGDSTSQSSQYTDGLLIDRSGYLWVGSRKGLYRSHQRVGNAGEYSEQIYFSEIRVDGISIPDSVTRSNNTLVLAPYQHGIQIRFSLIRPGSEKEVEYTYRLEGHDKDWSSADASRVVHYQDLPAGKSTFVVRAESVDGTFIAEAELPIEVKKYFYLQWWFWSIVVLVFLIGIGILFVVRVRLLKSRYQMLAAHESSLAQSEMTALRAQLNPHFLFNSLNSIKHFIIANEPRIATRYLNKFAALMRLALDNSRHSLIPLQSEIDFLSLFLELEKLRLDDKMDYDIITDPDLAVAGVEIPPMILQPFVENAIWHGILNRPDKGHIWVRLSRKDGDLEIEIEDDGIGRAASAAIQGEHKTRKSMGMKLIRERLDLLEKVYRSDVTIQIRDLSTPLGEPAGTSVVIRLPLQYRMHESTQGDYH